MLLVNDSRPPSIAKFTELLVLEQLSPSRNFKKLRELMAKAKQRPPYVPYIGKCVACKKLLLSLYCAIDGLYVSISGSVACVGIGQIIAVKQCSKVDNQRLCSSFSFHSMLIEVSGQDSFFSVTLCTFEW